MGKAPNAIFQWVFRVIHYVPMGMAQGESIEKIMNVLFKDVVPMAQEKQNIARASYTQQHEIL